MRTEDEFVARVTALLADGHERPESTFDSLIPRMREAYSTEGWIGDGDLEILLLGCDDDDLMDKLATMYPLTNEIAASLESGEA